MPDPSPTPRCLVDADLSPVREALQALAAAQDALTEHEAARTLWLASTNLLRRTPSPDSEAVAAEEELVEGAVDQLVAEQDLAGAIVEAIDSGNGRVSTKTIQVGAATTHVVHLGRAVISGMGAGAEEVIGKLAALANVLVDGRDLS